MCADHVGTWPVTGGQHWTPPHLSSWGQGDQQNQGRGHTKEDISIGAASRMNTLPEYLKFRPTGVCIAQTL